jgi:hypothetical protein
MTGYVFWRINIGLLTAVGFFAFGHSLGGNVLLCSNQHGVWMLLGLRFTRDCRVGTWKGGWYMAVALLVPV